RLRRLDPRPRLRRRVLSAARAADPGPGHPGDVAPRRRQENVEVGSLRPVAHQPDRRSGRDRAEDPPRQDRSGAAAARREGAGGDISLLSTHEPMQKNGHVRALCRGQAPWHHCVASRGLWNMSTTRRRRSYEAGHKPKWLVVIDDTEECDRAVYFAARRAARVGAGVIMLRVIETHDRNQQWAGVADIMKAEAHEEANAALAKYATRANGMAGI